MSYLITSTLTQGTDKLNNHFLYVYIYIYCEEIKRKISGPIDIIIIYFVYFPKVAVNINVIP